MKRQSQGFHLRLGPELEERAKAIAQRLMVPRGRQPRAYRAAKRTDLLRLALEFLADAVEAGGDVLGGTTHLPGAFLVDNYGDVVSCAPTRGERAYEELRRGGMPSMNQAEALAEDVRKLRHGMTVQVRGDVFGTNGIPAGEVGVLQIDPEGEFSLCRGAGRELSRVEPFDVVSFEGPEGERS